MRTLCSIIMREADATKVPAGSALAVDRDLFSGGVTRALENHPNITIVRERIDALPSEGLTIVATGPLTAAGLASSIGAATGKDALAFFDAIAPIVYRDSVDMDIAWMASRWDKVGPIGDGKDYINCPMDKDQYHAFVQGLVDGEKTEIGRAHVCTPRRHSSLEAGRSRPPARSPPPASPAASSPRPARTRSPFSTRAPPSSTATASTWTSPGWQAAGTRSGRSATARTISTARWTRINITPSFRGWSTAKRPSSRIGKRTRLTLRAACRSK